MNIIDSDMGWTPCLLEPCPGRLTQMFQLSIEDFYECLGLMHQNYGTEHPDTSNVV